jgi:polyhydroxyalkanoate synthesis regulator phasin
MATQPPKQTPGGNPAARPAGGTPPAEQPPATSGAPGEPSPAAADASTNPHERIDGLRSWIAQLERKLNIRAIAIGVISVLALAGAIYAIVLARDLDKEGATQAELEDVREELASVRDTASEAAEDDVQSIAKRITALEEDFASVEGADQKTEQQISVLQDDIQDLRDQIADLESSGSTTTTTTTTEESP